MGACCGTPAGWAEVPADALRDGVEVMDSSDQDGLTQACDVAARSFAGTAEIGGAPEFDWLLTGPGKTNAEVLRDKGNPERTHRVRACMDFCAYYARMLGRRGLVLVVRGGKDEDEDKDKDPAKPKEVVGVVVLCFYPKGYSKSADGCCAFLRAGIAAGADKWTPGQNEFMNSKRMAAIDKAMSPIHLKHGSGPHIYTWVVAVAPEAQGAGVGRRLLRAVNAIADAARLPCYLECTGERNEAIYGKLGYEVAGREDVAVPGDEEPLPGSLCAMVRQPRA